MLISCGSMIFRADASTLHKVMPLAAQFRDHVAMADVPIEDIEANLLRLIERDSGVVFYYERAGVVHGALVLAETHTWFSASVKLAVELAWFVEEDQRRGPAAIRLIDAAEAWAAMRGCKFLVMHSIGGEVESVTADKILGRLGYQRREQTFAKEISDASSLDDRSAHWACSQFRRSQRLPGYAGAGGPEEGPAYAGEGTTAGSGRS